MTAKSLYTSILAATLATGAIAPVALAKTPTPSPTPAATTPAKTPATAKPTTEEPAALPAKIQLTKEQQAKMQAIRAERNKQITAVVPADQRAKFTAAIKDEQKLKPALQALAPKLTKEQQLKILEIVKKSNQDMIAVLTPQQKQQLQQLQSQTKKN
jgi:periplasmic protein CpxP/Spy